LVDGIKHNYHALTRRSVAEEFAEQVDKFADLFREWITVARGGGKIVAKPTQRAAKIGGADAGSDKVGDKKTWSLRS
jgi:hypothetical protein